MTVADNVDRIDGFMAELADAAIDTGAVWITERDFSSAQGCAAAACSAPRLTSVHIPWREMTKNGIAELLNLCYGFNRPVTRTFPVSVSLRASVAKRRRTSSRASARPADF
ncbi:hypothetical protein [Massilia sp. Root335]|uniref:hypothetical protein n=1 Tax=Massilia sp. Root335 TaxID=1736517 RepID=UPI0006FF0A34|nr:hypothetical protein [Massilia sp. Root335]KQV40889.1 hypothetical protein ASC93_16945 [Massilia sp. Root335]